MLQQQVLALNQEAAEAAAARRQLEGEMQHQAAGDDANLDTGSARRRGGSWGEKGMGV